MMGIRKFKVGDKVKQINPQDWNMNNPIGIITTFDRCYMRILWEGTRWESGKGYPHLPREIEHVVKVGEQLMFDFMSKE